MPSKKTAAEIRTDLRAFLSETCPGIKVEVTHGRRWQRRCLKFQWAGFAGLLAEERFRLVARRIPPDYFEQHCRDAVWLELAPGETVDDYLRMPRSEDVDERLPAILKHLRELSFFPALEDELVRVSPAKCSDDFSISKRVLAAKNASAEQHRDALLAFMRKKAYCDWDVLRLVRPLAEE